MKKFYMTIVAMLCGVAAMAQSISVTAEDITAKSGDFTNLIFVLHEDPVGSFETFSLELDFPEGVLYRWYDEDEEDNVTNIKFPLAKGDHTTGFTPRGSGATYDPTHVVVSAMSAAATFKSKATGYDERVLVDMQLKVESSVADGEYEIRVAPTFAHEGYPISDQDPFTVKLTVGDGTGINSINAADAKAPVYNLAGQRVSKAQNGVFIQNGKKIAVK